MDAHGKWLPLEGNLSGRGVAVAGGYAPARLFDCWPIDCKMDMERLIGLLCHAITPSGMAAAIGRGFGAGGWGVGFRGGGLRG